MPSPVTILARALDAYVDIFGPDDPLGPEVLTAETSHVAVVQSASLPPSAPALDSPPPIDRKPSTAIASAPARPEFLTPADHTGLDPSSGPERVGALIPADSPLHDFSTLEEVSAWVAATVLIELDETRINPVFGVGNPNADLMVIGEAPGADEDQQGEPFVGRAGQLLTKILEATGFAREEVYIANILKSRPPGNRDPKPEEVAAHIPILYKQISLIQPKIMLCVGKTAGNSLLGVQTSLKELRGAFHDYHGIPVVVTYHPAALLRNSQWKRPTWEDMKMLRARFDQLTAAA